MSLVYLMELSLLLALHAMAIVGLVLSSQRRDAKDDFLMVMFTGACFIAIALGLLVVEYKIPNGSASSYTQIFENSDPQNLVLSILYGLFGIVYIYNNYTFYKWGEGG